MARLPSESIAALVLWVEFMSVFTPSDTRSSRPAPQSLRFATHISGASGHDLHIEGLWRPVINLAEGALRGHVLHVEVRQAVDAISTRPTDLLALNAVDQERIDIAAAEHGFSILAPCPATEAPPLTFVPVTWSSARSPRARRRLLQIAGKAQARLRILPVCEIHGLDPGTPPSAVREAAGALQPIFRGVLAKVPPKGGPVAALVDCGRTGAAVEAGDLAESRDYDSMLRTVLFLQRMGPGVMLHSLRSVAALTAARAAGARWASLDVVRSGWHVANAALEALSEPAASAL